MVLSPHKRHRFQFRLRHLLALQAAVALFFAFAVLCARVADNIAQNGRRTVKERTRRLETLQNVGYVNDDDGEIRIVQANSNCGDDDCRSLIPFADEVVDLDLHGTRITDKTGVVVARLRRLRSLNVSHTAVTSAFCRNLSGLNEFVYLHMAGCRVSAGVKYIVARRVVYLNLADTDIDDAGLLLLAQVDSLRNLNVAGTRVTARGARSFRERRDDVQLMY